MLGTTLLNRYRLAALLGQGGMGTVYRARDEVLQRDVAVKVLQEAGLGTQGRARLLEEARAAARLNHPNIVGVHDAGEADGVAFIVLELVEGATLYERWPLPLEQTVAVARQVCAALEHAHSHGVIHRDLKPENVVLTPDGTAKLMDFGLARAAVAGRATPEGAVLGTVFYLAPEQVTGRTVDGRADLYSLGVMLYELATGKLPFNGADPVIIVSQHLHAPVPPPSTYRPDLPPALEAIILRLLAKDPAERFASAAEAAAALGQVFHSGNGARPAAGAHHNLPLQLTRFIGREREIAEVQRRLAAARLVSLTGSGGCGKTRLALQVAERLRQPEAGGPPAFPDGIWLVELGTLTDPALLPQTVAALLNVREEPGHALLKTLTDALQVRTLLLILDNCEHLIDACAQFAEAVLRACPEVRILATSREALSIAGEAAYRVPSLTSPDPAQPAEPAALAQFEAVRLFVDRVTAIRPDFTLNAANAAAVAQICGQLDGLPLALELAAARARAMSVEQIAARLDDRFRLLTGGSRTALPRQQTLRALIDWSWELLSEPERRLLRRLAVFLGGWTLEAAEAVCAGGPEPAPAADVLEQLTRLVDKSIVLVEETNTGGRYRLLETIRQYAREKLLEAGEAEPVRDRHLAYFRKLADKAEPELRSVGQLAWIELLEAEHDNFRSALKWSLHGASLEAGLGIAGALARFWYLRGYWREGRQWLRDLLAKPADPEPTPAGLRARARALAGAGWLADEDGSEMPLYTDSLALYRQLGDKWGCAFALRGLASGLYDRQADQAGVLALFTESEALFREVGDPWGIGAALFGLGWLSLTREAPARAAEQWQAALGYFRRSGDRWGVAVTLGALGYLARLRGEYPQAVALTEEGLALFQAMGDKAGIATSLLRLGTVAFRRGEYRQAQALIERGIAVNRERGNLFGALVAASFLGLIHSYQGDFERAEALHRESLTLDHNSSSALDYPYMLDYAGLSLYLQGRLAEAEARFQESLALPGTPDDKLSWAMATNGLGLVAYRRGQTAEARRLLEASLARYQEIGDRRFVGIALHDLGHVRAAAGEHGPAADLFRQGLALRRELGDKQAIAESLESLAGLPGEAPARAARMLGAAAALRSLIGAPLPPVEAPEHAALCARLRAALGEAGWQAAWEAGGHLTLEQAVRAALDPAAE